MGTLLENRTATRKAVYAAEEEASRARVLVREAAGKLATAEKHGYKTVEQRRQEQEAYQAHLAEAERAVEAAKQAEQAAALALHEARAARLVSRRTAAIEAAGITDRIQVQVDWGDWDSFSSSRWTLQEMLLGDDGEWLMKEGKDYQGNPVRYPERRFGYSVDVYGPRRSYHDEWEGATVNWGTLGSLSVPDADAMLNLHRMGVELAAFLNRMRPTWYEEDQAD